jgi:hypothetical protein
MRGAPPESIAKHLSESTSQVYRFHATHRRHRPIHRVRKSKSKPRTETTAISHEIGEQPPVSAEPFWRRESHSRGHPLTR